MKTVRRIAAVVLALTIVLCVIVAVARHKEVAVEDGRLSIVTTIFPGYDWVRVILGDRAADVMLLPGTGVDPHSYQPTAKDIMRLAAADLVIILGGENDGWVDSAATGMNTRLVRLLDVLGSNVKEEVIVAGMQATEANNGERDEHVWLSLRNARALCAAIANALCELDAQNAATYRVHLAAYTAELDALDAEYTAAVNGAMRKTVLFGDRFPFRYLVDDYDLQYYAAFAGCSAETEASFKTVIFLARKVDELSLPTVLTIENSDGKLARAIIENTKSRTAKVATLNSMQATTTRDIQEGTRYLDIMQENLRVLKTALYEDQR